jgi:hypothetical protein
MPNEDLTDDRAASGATFHLSSGDCVVVTAMGWTSGDRAVGAMIVTELDMRCKLGINDRD